nr:MAG TPA: hypothetical protein [Caudoviricetes sp.]
MKQICNIMIVFCENFRLIIKSYSSIMITKVSNIL